MPLIFPSNTLSAGGFSVDNSCRFNDGDSAYMYRSNGTPTSQRILTISTWLKRGTDMATTDVYQYWMGIQDTGVGDPRLTLGFNDSGQLNTGEKNGAGADVWKITTNRVFRDPGAFYHIVLSIDTTQGTEANRVKIYVNGTQETSFATSTYPTENFDMDTTGNEINIACIDNNSPSGFFDGYIAEMVYCDGQAYAASDFGEFDEDSPTIWKPIDVSGLTFGDNGFYLDFEDSANLGNDANGGTDFTTSGLAATDQATDTPTNNFCVMNPLAASSYSALSEGNTQTAGDSASDNGNVISTFVPSNGKWYCESLVETGLPTGYPAVGLAQASDANFGTVLNSTVGVAGYDGSTAGVLRPDGQKYSNNSTASWTSTTFDTDDILMMAMDCDNGAFYIGKNDVWMESGDPTSGASKTGAFLTWTPASETGQAFASKDYNTSVLQWNFGNPTFAITSGNADADGYGNFEYAVPSGYYALCTKNIGAYGG